MFWDDDTPRWRTARSRGCNITPLTDGVFNLNFLERCGGHTAERWARCLGFQGNGCTGNVRYELYLEKSRYERHLHRDFFTPLSTVEDGAVIGADMQTERRSLKDELEAQESELVIILSAHAVYKLSRHAFSS